jgi:hypothetical protein
MGTTIHVAPNRPCVVLGVFRRRPNGLLTTPATVRTTNDAPAMASWRLQDRPPIALRVLQCRFDFLVRMSGPSHLSGSLSEPLSHAERGDEATWQSAWGKSDGGACVSNPTAMMANLARYGNRPKRCTSGALRRLAFTRFNRTANRMFQRRSAWITTSRVGQPEVALRVGLTALRLVAGGWRCIGAYRMGPFARRWSSRAYDSVGTEAIAWARAAGHSTGISLGAGILTP